MKIIVWDLEIFPFDFLGGFLTIHENGSTELFQSWSREEIKEFFEENKLDSIFVGHNSYTYDAPVLESIIKGKNPYDTSQKIIKDNIRMRCYLNFYQWDTMTVRRTPFSLKLTELIAGKNISTSDVDFDLARPLTLEEKLQTESYNKDDLEQTLYNFKRFAPQFELKLNIINTFGLPLKEGLKCTEAQLAAKVLGAKKDPSLEYKLTKPKIWPTLRIKNQKLLDWYLNEEFMKNNMIVNICGCEHTLGKGGIHAAKLRTYCEKVLYYDVSGYYNLVMINLDLLPRTLSQEGKEKYINMYHEQLEMKKDPSKKNARKAYKTILLSVFGSANNQYGDFYDPSNFYKITLSGELFIIDLLEKLEGLVEVIQSNTDGIVLLPFNWDDEEKIDSIIKEWENRTGFNMEKGYLYNLWQRDVNCYFALDEKGEIDYKGEVINYKTDDVAYGACRLFDANNPPIIAKGIIDYLLFDILPEETVEANKKDLINFQYQAKKGTYSFMTYDTIKLIKGKSKKAKEEEISSELVKPLNRAFAAKIEYDSEGNAIIHTLVKHKDPGKKGASSAKVANLPPSIFIYNDEILNAYELLKDKINYQYYIDTIYEKVLDYLPEK